MARGDEVMRVKTIIRALVDRGAENGFATPAGLRHLSDWRR
jgi:hypothetical protein